MRVIYDGKLDITQLVKTVVWNTEIMGSAGTLEIELVEPDPYSPALITFVNGAIIDFFYDDRPIFKGRLLKKVRNDKNRTRVLYCEDQLRYLIKNQKNGQYLNIRTSDLIIKFCEIYGINIGEIEKTRYVHPAIRYESVTSLMDIIYQTMGRGILEGNDKFCILYDDFGKLNFRSSDRLMIMDKYLTRNEFLLDLEEEASIEDTATYFVITQEKTIKQEKGKSKKELIFFTEKTDKINQYGMITHWEDVQEGMTVPQINQLMENLKIIHGREELKLNIKSLGIYCRAGNSILIERKKGKAERFVIENVTHTFKNANNWTMELNLKNEYFGK